MTDKKKDSKMGAGLVLGMLLGAVGGILFAPKSGKESREAMTKKMNDMKGMIENGEMQAKIQEIFGDLSDESVKLYTNTKDGVIKGIEELKTMDKDDYARLVQNVIDKVRKESQVSSEKAGKLKDEFMKEYPKMKDKTTKKAPASKGKLLAKSKK